MDDIERRIRGARPAGPRPDDPLSDRAREEFQQITGHSYRSPGVQRSSWIRVAMAAVAVVTLLAVGVLVLRQNEDSATPTALSEGTEHDTDTPDTPVSSSDVWEMAADSDLVVVVEAQGSTADLATVTVTEVLVGEVDTSQSLTVIQGVDPVGDPVTLHEIDAEQLILFLAPASERGAYEFVDSAQGVLGVEAGLIYPVFTDLDLDGAQTLDQLRERLGTR